ncbi:hypothetical protein AC579_6653 [Pseudocercospora musae]|uniref:Uncharacterized protein n=1 Tax=Pseudocercospora musae TaxID=113226 RepID=A0A139IPW9_9PEZI|nr:hypothetical protein AC579_6653 [Pseudocercospora musae]
MSPKWHRRLPATEMSFLHLKSKIEKEYEEVAHFSLQRLLTKIIPKSAGAETSLSISISSNMTYASNSPMHVSSTPPTSGIPHQ